MRLVSIEMKHAATVVINTANICSIYEAAQTSPDPGTIVIRMVCGHEHTTKFTGVEHAVDYIKRAEYTEYPNYNLST